MKRILALSLILVLAISAAALAKPEFTAVYGTPVIDGILDEVWKNAPVVELTMDNYEAIGGSYVARGPGGFAAGGRFRVMWDEENLYLFADIADRDGSFNASPGANFIRNDLIQVCIKPDPSVENGQGRFIFDIIATSNVGTPLVWENWTIPGNVDLPIAGLTFFGGYTIEVAFPWEILQPAAVAEGVSFPFGPFILDATSDGERKGFLFPWPDGNDGIGNEDSWTVVTLVK